MSKRNFTATYLPDSKINCHSLYQLYFVYWTHFWLVGWNYICKWGAWYWRIDSKGNGESWEGGSHYCCCKRYCSFLWTYYTT